MDRPGTDDDASELEALRVLATGDRSVLIDHALATARAVLGMDIAYYSEFEGDAQVILAAAGDPSSFGFEPGARVPLADSYCRRMVAGEIPHVISDARFHVEVADLQVTRDADMGAYIGVPLRLPDGRLYGTLCCASHAAEPDLGEREVRVLQVIARMIGDELALADLRRSETEQRERLLRLEHGVQVNECVIQHLVAAKYHLEAGRLEAATETIAEATREARRFASDLLPEEIEPGGLRL